MQAYARRVLWQIDRTGGGALTNERAANITGPNPYRLNPWWLWGGVEFRVGALNGATFTGVRIYATYTGGAALLGFPPPGTVAEAAASVGNPGAANQGVWRIFKGIGASAGTTLPLTPIPPWLLLEYDMAAAGAGPSTLFVSALLCGLEVSGHE